MHSVRDSGEGCMYHRRDNLCLGTEQGGERGSRRRIKSFKERMGDNFTAECNKIEKVIRLYNFSETMIYEYSRCFGLVVKKCPCL